MKNIQMSFFSTRYIRDRMYLKRHKIIFTEKKMILDDGIKCHYFECYFDTEEEAGDVFDNMKLFMASIRDLTYKK